MSLPDSVIQDHANRLLAARQMGRPTDLVTDLSPGITGQNARRIAEATLQGWGQPFCGYKLGYTSEAMRQQMGISQPNFGRLTSGMDFSDGVSGPLIHPRVEPEIALRIGFDISCPPQTDEELFALVDAVFPALEIVDTRYHNYIFRYEDNVADNSSAAGYVLGDAHAPDVLLGPGWNVRLDVGEGDRVYGHSSAALGGPLHALRWLVNETASTDETIPAGSIILTGGLTAASPFTQGQTASADFAVLGTVSVNW